MIVMRFTFFHFCLIAVLVFLNAENVRAQSFNYLNLIDPQGLLNQGDTKNNLYQQIVDEMNQEYINIGKREAARVLANRATTVTGGLNSIGLTYRRPFADFSISADRVLAPALPIDGSWLVTDTFSIYIDASRLLSNLKDQRVIDISQKNLAAFAGIVFKRTYTTQHRAASYEEGLTTHFEKLFLPFAGMKFSNVANLKTNEAIIEEDFLSLKMGGIASAPLYTGIDAVGGVLAKFSKMSRVEIVSNPGVTEGGDVILLSYEKTKSASTGFSIGVQADFLKILRMTLLSYDFSYELASSYKIYLNFKQNDLREMLPGNPVEGEINQLLKNREGDLSVLAPYVISEEKRIAQTLNHKYNFLLLGGAKSSKTTQIEITTNGRVKNFFRHYFDKVKYTESLISRLFASVIYAITNSNTSAATLASDTKQVAIEYDSEKNLLENHEDLNIKDNEQKLSLTFNAEFESKKSKGFIGKKYRDRAVYLLSRYSNVDPLAIKMVQNESLVAPYSITGKYEVNIDGIRHLNSESVGEVFDHLNNLCNEYPKNKFFNFRNLFDNCRRSLQNDYIAYFKDLSHEKITASVIDKCESKSRSIKFLFSPAKKRAFLKSCLSSVTYKDKSDWVEIPLWSLKNLTTNIVNTSYTKFDYYNLFGAQNVFFYGNFEALTSDGRNFTTSFHEGEFKGLGVVDHYMRQENLRAPASVVVDQ